MNKHEEIRNQLCSHLDTGFDGRLDCLLAETMSSEDFKYFRSKFRGKLYSHIVIRCLHPAAGDLYGYLKATEATGGTTKVDFWVWP